MHRVMAALARTAQLGDLQLVHGDVVAGQAWAPVVGSPEKWSLTIYIDEEERLYADVVQNDVGPML